MSISESEIVSELTACGASINDYVLIGENFYVVNSKGSLVDIVVDDLPGESEGEMHMAVVSYLIRQGCPCFKSEEEFFARGL